MNQRITGKRIGIKQVRDHLPWLCQGDIFGNTPVIDVTLDGADDLQVESPLGHAVLLTHGCAMDKPNTSGEPRVDLLQFARLRTFDVLPLDKQQSLRGGRTKLGPFEALYVDAILDLGECFILLTDPYYLPAKYFKLAFGDYSDHPDAESDAKYVTPQSHDTRLGCLDEVQVDLLQRKMLAFWARVTEQS